MSFTVRLIADLISVEAGATVPVSIEVANKGAEADRFELQMEGLDPEWTAVPEPDFIVDPGEVRIEKAFFKVPRSSESQAGNYPFVVRVRSLNSGEARTGQGALQVKPFHYLTMEIGPKKGTFSPTKKQNSFTVTVLNLGNTEHTLQLFGNDPEEACTYDFESEQVSISPGQQKTVELEVTPTATPFLSSSRLHGFSVSGRSIETPSVLASAQAQLEQRPFVTPGLLTLLIFTVIIIGAWIALIPKPPKVTLAISSRTVTVGEVIKVSWRGENANSVQVLVDGQPLVNEATVFGETEYVAQKEGSVEFTAKAIRDQKESEVDSETLTIEKPAPSPEVKLTLRPRRKTINLGESVELDYSIENAVDAYLQPGPQKLVLTLKSITVQPNKEGSNEYEIVATDKDGKVSTVKATVNVVDRAKVVVLAFNSSPSKLDVGGGYVTLKWQISNAARVEITGGPEPLIPNEPNVPGSQEFMIDKTTTFIIKAIDANGKSVSKTIKVEVAEPSAPPIGTGDPGTVPPPVTTTTGGVN